MAKAKKQGRIQALSRKNEKKQDGEERVQAVHSAIEQIERQFGKGSIMKLGEHSGEGIEGIPTGALTLDFALGVGGFARGRVIEIFGPESSGKTTLCLSGVANAQKAGGIAAFVDAEHALDPVFAQRLGVNIDDLLVSQPDNGEEALEITESLVRSNAVDIIIVDSVAALVPRSELEGNMGDAQMGLHARLMSQALRKLTGTISRSRTTVIFVNQIRHKIGVMFGSPETTTGGNALKFYASVRLDIRRIETLKKADVAYGNRVRVKVVKNKLAPPFRQAEFEILFNQGINYEGCLLDLAVASKLIERSGTWYSYNKRMSVSSENNASSSIQHPFRTTVADRNVSPSGEPIAIVGMACRFPGAEDLDAFWQLLVEGRNSVSEGVPGSDEGRMGDLFGDHAVQNPACRFGAFVDGIDQFDPTFFRISPVEAELLDPQQRMMLETSWLALEDAGIDPGRLSGSCTGVYTGISTDEYRMLVAESSKPSEAAGCLYALSGTNLNGASGRVSFVLGLMGPAKAVDTACASSLVSIHDAVADLQQARQILLSLAV